MDASKENSKAGKRKTIPVAGDPVEGIKSGGRTVMPIRDRVPIRVVPGTIRPTIKASFARDIESGKLKKILSQNRELRDEAMKARDGREVAALFVKVRDVKGATRGGIPVMLENSSGKVLARSFTDPRGNVLLPAGESGKDRELRIRVLGDAAAKSTKVVLLQGTRAQRVDLEVPELPQTNTARAFALIEEGASELGEGGSALENASAVDDAMGELEDALEHAAEVAADPNATQQEIDDAAAEVAAAAAAASAAAGEDAPASVLEAIEEAERIGAGDLTDASDAAEAVEEARALIARQAFRDALVRFRDGNATLEELLEAIKSGELDGQSLGNDLFNLLPLDFAPEIFDLIVSEGLVLTDPILSKTAGPGDFRRARTRQLKNFALPRIARTPVADTRYVVRFRQEWAFLGYTLGGLIRSDPLDPGELLRATESTVQTLRRSTSTEELEALRQLAMETKRRLQQTSSIDNFVNTSTNVATRNRASGFGSIGPKLSFGKDLVGGIIGGVGGALIGGIPGAVAGAFLGSGGSVGVGGEVGTELLTSVDTTTSLRSNVHSTLQVNNLLQTTQSVVDKELRNLVATLEGIDKTLAQTSEQVSPLLNRVTNLLRWSLHENYAVVTHVEDVVPIRVIQLTDLTVVDTTTQTALATLLDAIRDLRATIARINDAIRRFPPDFSAIVDAIRTARTQLQVVEDAANGLRATLGLRTLGGGAILQSLDRLNQLIDQAQALADSSNVGAALAVGGIVQQIGQVASEIEAQVAALSSDTAPIFAPEDVVEYRRIFEPVLLEPLLAPRFASLRRDLELLRAAAQPVHRIDVTVEHTTVSAKADLRVSIDGQSVTMELDPKRKVATVSLFYPTPTAQSGLGPARLALDIQGPELSDLPSPGFPFPGNIAEQLFRSILESRKSRVHTVKFRYHTAQGVFFDQIVHTDDLKTDGSVGPDVTKDITLTVPRPAVNPMEDPLVRHVNRNRIFYLGLLMRAAMAEPSLRDDAPHLAALNGDNPIWQLPILGFEGDRILVVDRLGPNDTEASGWLNEPGAATLVQLAAAGSYGEALQGLLKLEEITSILHPALAQPLPPVMPPIALVDLTGKRLVPEDVTNGNGLPVTPP